MKELSTKRILKFTRVDQIFQINLTIVYLIFIIARNSMIFDWLELKKSKKNEILETYIENLDWFQLMKEENNKNERIN